MIKNLMQRFKKNERFLKFLIVGGVNTIFGYSIFAFFILMKLQYPAALLLATICGILFNFKTTGTIVFKNNNRRLIFRFLGVYAVIYSLNVVLIGILKSYNINVLLAGALLVLPLTLLSYKLNKTFVFSGYK
jgi:putative flippase GtrA